MDLLIFNPPYVPTEDQELEDAQHEAKIAGSWAGGAVGMDVTDRLLAQTPVWPPLFQAFASGTTNTVYTEQHLLASGGRFYLVAVPQNRPHEILSRMQAEGGLDSHVASLPQSRALYRIQLIVTLVLHAFREYWNDERAESDFQYCVSSSLELRVFLFGRRALKGSACP